MHSFNHTDSPPPINNNEQPFHSLLSPTNTPNYIIANIPRPFPMIITHRNQRLRKHQFPRRHQLLHRLLRFIHHFLALLTPFQPSLHALSHDPHRLLHSSFHVSPTVSAKMHRYAWISAVTDFFFARIASKFALSSRAIGSNMRRIIASPIRETPILEFPRFHEQTRTPKTLGIVEFGVCSTRFSVINT